MSTRALLTLLVGALAVGALIGAQVCPRSAHGQAPVGSATKGLPESYMGPAMSPCFQAAGHPGAMPGFIDQGYAKAIERLYILMYEGYLTRPGHERDEDEKFMRGLRAARMARDRAKRLVFDEPWHAVTPLPGMGTGYPLEPYTPAPYASPWGKPERTP